MTDLDFDELDKAVNSLMDQKDQVASAEGSAVTTRSPQPTESTASIQQSTTVVSASEPADLRPPTVPSVARRRGTFMDVFHPSSDMRTRATSSASSVSREGVNLAPQSTAKMELVNSPVAPVMPRQPNDKDLTNQLTEAKESESQAGAALYDPIAFAEQNEQPITDDALSDMPASDVNGIDEHEDKPVASSPLESPFLPDAKVEKRPLGSMAPLSPHTIEATPSEDAMVATSPGKLPDEFSRQMMDIEAEQRTTPVVSEEAVVSETPNVDIADDDVTPPLASATVHDSEREPPIQGAIPQQYTEKNSSEATNEHATIFDPAYHGQDMKHQEKKKSGWGMVLMIIALVVLGGAGGVAYYYFTTGGF